MKIKMMIKKMIKVRIVLIDKSLLVNLPKFGEEIRIGHCTPIKIIFTKFILIGITDNVSGFERMTGSKKLIAWL